MINHKKEFVTHVFLLNIKIFKLIKCIHIAVYLKIQQKKTDFQISLLFNIYLIFLFFNILIIFLIVTKILKRHSIELSTLIRLIETATLTKSVLK